MFDEKSAVDASRAALLGRVAALLPEWEAGAARLDADSRVPETELRQLREAGGLTAPLPVAAGGLGLGTEPSGAPALLRLLRLIGRANLSLGRIFEGYVNALKLVAVYGSTEQLRQAAADARDGHLFAIWATEAADPVRIVGAPPHALLRGGKVFCSAAAQATRALITATSETGEARMLLVPLRAGERARTGLHDTDGMRACGTGNVDFTGISLSAAALIGQPGDHMRQPEFSAGA